MDDPPQDGGGTVTARAATRSAGVMVAREGDIDPVIVDLDKSKRFERLSDRRRFDNLIRLDRSVEKLNRRTTRITSRDRWRFFLEYLGGERLAPDRLGAFLARRDRAISRHRFGWTVGARLRGRRPTGATPRNGAPA